MPSIKGQRYKIKDETGKTYGKLTVIGRAPQNIATGAAWICKCNCGCETTKITSGTRLRLGRASSCKSRKLTEQQIYDRTHGLRECHTCKQMRPCEEFPYLIKHECKTCRGRNTFILKRLYGITEEEYAQMLSDQGGVCVICGDPPGAGSRHKKYLLVDHRHDGTRGNKENVRGLLCGNCNSGLGYFKDNVSRLQSAIDYVKRHESKITLDKINTLV